MLTEDQTLAALRDAQAKYKQVEEQIINFKPLAAIESVTKGIAERKAGVYVW